MIGATASDVRGCFLLAMILEAFLLDNARPGEDTINPEVGIIASSQADPVRGIGGFAGNAQDCFLAEMGLWEAAQQEGLTTTAAAVSIS